MAIEAKVNPTWAWKWTILAIACLGFGAYCVYDATVGYPAHNQKVAAFAHYQPDVHDKLFDETGAPRGWSYNSSKLNYKGLDDYPAYAKAHGWSDDNPGAPHYDADIFTQWVMLGISAFIALAAFGWVFTHKGTRLTADDEAFTATDGTRIPYAHITKINKAKWNSKGIAVVHYRSDSGDEYTTKIDDWVYRDGDLVLEQIEQHTGLGDLVPGD